MHKANNSLPSLAKNLIFDYKVGDKIYKINSMNEFILGTNETVSIYDVLDALVNIAIDNVKDQELFALQATVETGTMYAALISLGLPASDIITMMYNPVMQDMLTLVRNDSSVKINEFIKAYKKIVTARLVNVAGVPIEEIDFSKAPIGIQDLEYMLTADPFKALKITLTSGKERKIDTVANLDSLTKKQLGELYQFLHIMDTATHLGDNIKNISSFLSILRGMPITFEGIQEVEKAIEKLGRVIENENDSKLLDSVDTMSRDEILDILNTLGASFYTKEKDAGYKIEGFFSRNPHILSAYRRLLQLKKAIQDNFPYIANP
jgi:hypothetical protein